MSVVRHAVGVDIAYKLAASIALHSLRLAIPCVVVGTPALVARSSTVGCDTIATTAISTSEATSTSAHCGTGAGSWVGTIAGDMTHLTAGVASASSSAAADTESRTISLNVA